MTEQLIFKKMAQVMADTKSVPKAGRNASQGFNFRTVDDTVQSVNSAMTKHGVVMIPNVLSATYDTETSAKGSTVTTCHVLVAYQFFAEDGSMVEMTMAGEGKDHGDKATSKSLSMALKYGLFQAFLIPTGDPDPDGEVVEVITKPGALSTSDKTRLTALRKQSGVDADKFKSLIQDALGRQITSTSDLVKGDLPEIEAYLQEFNNNNQKETA